MYKPGDKVRIVDVDKIYMGGLLFRNGDETHLFLHKEWNCLALAVKCSSTGLTLYEDEYDGIEKVV